MSAVGDALRAIRSVLLLQNQVSGLEQATAKLARDVDDLTGAVQVLAVRVARLEGFIEGAAATTSSRRRLTDD